MTAARIALLTVISIGTQLSANGAGPDVRGFFDRHCVKCHSGDKPKGDLLLDKLTADFADTTDRERWERILEQLENGSMPPKAKPRPPAQEQRAGDGGESEIARDRGPRGPAPAEPERV